VKKPDVIQKNELYFCNQGSNVIQNQLSKSKHRLKSFVLQACVIFSLAIQPIILSLDSQLNIWYLDDGTLADYPEVDLSDFKKVMNLFREIWLE
jgi:hypothetical protein